MTSAAGKSLGRYEIVKHLASGGMAQVLLARVTGIEGFERYVVVKRIHRERANDTSIVKMFIDEARLAAALHHHNIVQVHDIGQEDGEYFFTMEYLHGEDLRTILTKLNQRQGHLPLEHVITIVNAAAAGLHYAHDFCGPDRKPLNIVHRDVSPANIIVGYQGEVKVLDFGIAKAALRQSETQSGTLKGKISYMSPEQCMGHSADRRSDVFALGVVLWELFTVRRLFKGTSEFLTMSAIVQGNIPKPSIHRATPPELEAIMMKALALAPEQRYQSADELRIALDAFATKAKLRLSMTALGEYMVSEFGRRPEPWLVDDDEYQLHVGEVDFDGSPVPMRGNTQPRMPTPPVGSLLARAKRKMAPATGVEITPMPPVLANPPPAPTTTAERAAALPEPAPQLRPRRRWIILLAAIVPVAIVALVLVLVRSSTTSASPPQPTADKVTLPVIAPTPPPEPAPEPALVVEPGPEVVAAPAPAEGSGSAIAEPAKTATVAKKRPRPRPKSPEKPPAKWNPDSLFLKKKK